MKDKLIQILSNAPHGAVGIGPSDAELAEHILSKLRCSECLHWRAFRTHLGTCTAPVSWHSHTTDAKDFCSHWSPKQ